MGCSSSQSKSKQLEVNAPDPTELFLQNGAFTRVDPELFETPVQRLGVSGGTAAFFRLKLESPENRTVTHFIGKDLSRARDEVTFYEDVLRLAGEKDDSLA